MAKTIKGVSDSESETPKKKVFATETSPYGALGTEIEFDSESAELAIAKGFATVEKPKEAKTKPELQDEEV
jgi:hypothetical protein